MENLVQDIVKESQPQWGGSWTEKKLDAFANYVSAYLNIMKKYPYWETLYFDGFAGSGDRSAKNFNNEVFEQLSISRQEERLYKGAAERVLSLPDNLSFKYHYFIDANKDSLARLEIKLSELQKTKTKKFQFRAGDCNEQLFKLSNAMKRNKKLASLVLLDPFGMQINWESIASLKGTHTDIWILIPTGVIVNRLLDKACKLTYSTKLQSFFGLDEKVIIDYFYTKEKQANLFGDEDNIITKVSKPIDKIAILYSKQLRKIWDHVMDKPLILKNSKGVPIFHFIFASNNETALKIAKQITKSINYGKHKD